MRDVLAAQLLDLALHRKFDSGRALAGGFCGDIFVDDLVAARTIEVLRVAHAVALDELVHDSGLVSRRAAPTGHGRASEPGRTQNVLEHAHRVGGDDHAGGDRHLRVRRRSRARGGLWRRRRPEQLAPCLRTDDPVDAEAARALERAHGSIGARTEDPVGRARTEAGRGEPALQVDDRRAARAQAQRRHAGGRFELQRLELVELAVSDQLGAMRRTGTAVRWFDEANRSQPAPAERRPPPRHRASRARPGRAATALGLPRPLPFAKREGLDVEVGSGHDRLPDQ